MHRISNRKGAMLLDGKSLQELKRANIKEVNPDALVDISEIEINTKQSVQNEWKNMWSRYITRILSGWGSML